MTAPITSNGPITTQLHHYAGRYSFNPLSYRLFEAKRYIENVGISVKTWCVTASTA